MKQSEMIALIQTIVKSKKKAKELLELLIKNGHITPKHFVKCEDFGYKVVYEWEPE